MNMKTFESTHKNMLELIKLVKSISSVGLEDWSFGKSFTKFHI